MPDAARLLDELRTSATARLEQLDAELGELRIDRGRELADDEHDPEGATLSDEWSTLEALRAATVTELAEVDQALARLEAGTYGICVDCGRAIPVARLRARPTATRCVDCAAKAGG